MINEDGTLGMLSKDEAKWFLKFDEDQKVFLKVPSMKGEAEVHVQRIAGLARSYLDLQGIAERDRAQLKASWIVEEKLRDALKKLIADVQKPSGHIGVPRLHVFEEAKEAVKLLPDMEAVRQSEDHFLELGAQIACSAMYAIHKGDSSGPGSPRPMVEAYRKKQDASRAEEEAPAGKAGV